MTNDYTDLLLSYLTTCSPSDLLNPIVVSYTNSSDSPIPPDPSDPSGIHDDKEKYGDYRMVDLRKYDSGSHQIEMGVYAVTRECAKELIKDDLTKENNLPEYSLTESEGDKRPVEIKSDKRTAYRYCNALSEKWGLTPYYTDAYDGTKSDAEDSDYGVRLPTNEEWEFAANADKDHLLGQGEYFLYSGPKWKNTDAPELLFSNSGQCSYPGYGDKSDPQNIDRWKFMYAILPEDTATIIDGIYYWEDIPDNPSMIGTHIDNYQEGDTQYSNSLANFSMLDLNNYAWTRLNLYNDGPQKSDIEDMPHVLPFFVYEDNKATTIENDHNWLKNSSYNPTDVFGFKNKLYKTNVRGWHNRVGDTAGSSNSFGTHAVGKLSPNDFGLYDMTGNVAELVEEGYYKGGSFASNQKNVQNNLKPTSEKVQGFRVCRTIKA